MRTNDVVMFEEVHCIGLNDIREQPQRFGNRADGKVTGAYFRLPSRNPTAGVQARERPTNRSHE